MKTKSVLLAVMMMGASLVALANEPGNPRVRVVNQKESGIYRLIYAGGNSGNVKLNILDDAGQVLFNETIKSKEGFIRSLNFTHVTPGEYTVEVENDGQKEVSKVSYMTSARPSQHVHVAKAAEGKYLFVVSNVVEESINVKIYDGAHHVVYDEMVNVNGSYGIVYNLEQVTGNPVFEVTTKAGVTTIEK